MTARDYMQGIKGKDERTISILKKWTNVPVQQIKDANPVYKEMIFRRNALRILKKKQEGGTWNVRRIA